MHLLSGIVLAQMVLNCWVGDGVLAVVKALKFLELVGSNLVAVTNLAICSNLAFIVHVSVNRFIVDGSSKIYPSLPCYRVVVQTRYL